MATTQITTESTLEALRSLGLQPRDCDDPIVAKEVAQRLGFKRVSKAQIAAIRDAAERLADELDAEQAADEPDAYEVPTAERSSLATTMSVYRERYGKEANCGDGLAAALKGADLEAVAAENSLDLAKWRHLNRGGQRMAVGNALRARLRHGEKVVVGGEPVNL
jgi:hypothetical protein